MTTADGSITLPAAGAVKFLGREPAYWRLRIKGAGLLFLTLGIYRFWFATDVRRYLWSSTEIGGETLEYTGLATELLGGFLLAIAIVVPLYTAIASAALALDAAQGAILAVAFILVVLLGQFALFRARRYRLTRTVFRGVPSQAVVLLGKVSAAATRNAPTPQVGSRIDSALTPCWTSNAQTSRANANGV